MTPGGISGFVGVLVAAAALAPGLVAFQVINAEAIEDLDAYAVYSAIVPMQVVAAKPIAILRETWRVHCLPSGKAFNEEWRSALESFKEENARPRTLLPRFQPEWPCERVPQTDVSSPRWGGYAIVSAVGFNQAKTRAMLFVMTSCGPFCGRGTFHFLEKRQGQWLSVALKEISNCIGGLAPSCVIGSCPRSLEYEAHTDLQSGQRR